MSEKQVRFYIAASYDDKEIAKKIALYFEDKYGWICTCYWWTHIKVNEFDRLSFAAEDLKSVKDSDLFFMYNSEKKTGGKMVEMGIALAIGIPVYIIGKKITTVFGELTNYLGEWKHE